MIIKKLLHKIVGVSQLKNEMTQQYQTLHTQMQQQNDKLLRLHSLVFSISKAANKSKIFLINTPEHNNLGDHVIASATIDLLQTLYPDRSIIEFSHDDWDAISPFLIKCVDVEDIICLQGGGHLGSIWVYEEEMRRSVIQHFPNNKIISLPQSITFLDDEEGRKQLRLSQQIYQKHTDLTVMTRGKISFERSKEYFPTTNCILAPDCVLFWEDKFRDSCQDRPREGVLFVNRSDKEKKCSDTLIQELHSFCSDHKIPFSITDTVIDEHPKSYNRHITTDNLFQLFSGAKLIITDRLHGMIFSFLMKTPCIVFPSADHKILESYEWIKQCDWIYFNPPIESINEIILKYYHSTMAYKSNLQLTTITLKIYKDFLNIKEG